MLLHVAVAPLAREVLAEPGENAVADGAVYRHADVAADVHVDFPLERGVHRESSGGQHVVTHQLETVPVDGVRVPPCDGPAHLDREKVTERSAFLARFPLTPLRLKRPFSQNVRNALHSARRRANNFRAERSVGEQIHRNNIGEDRQECEYEGYSKYRKAFVHCLAG